ncbi:MAG: hypothetical protein HOV80_24845 [Polyangiaceae bacterium]|nr:hypothetical protein [Polyangiaceae bacterium]
MSCAGTTELEKSPPPPPRGRISIAAGWSRSHLSFEGDDAYFDKPSIVLASDLYAGKFTITFGIGGLALGSLVTERERYDVDAGWIGAAGLSWSVLSEDQDLPYVVLSALLGATRASVRSQTIDGPAGLGSYLGLDFRFGATVGKTFFGWLSPYASARVFGGPVIWSQGEASKLGSDRFHVQGAVGAVFILPEHLDLFIEGSPGGEQGGFGGIGWRY